MSEDEIIDRVMMIDQWKTLGDIYTQDELNAIGMLLDLYYKQQKEIEEKERQLKIKNEYLQLAHDIAFDYDGCNTTESLKSLIDEIVELINKAYKNDDNSIIYIGGNGRKFNILHKEI